MSATDDNVFIRGRGFGGVFHYMEKYIECSCNNTKSCDSTNLDTYSGLPGPNPVQL